MLDDSDSMRDGYAIVHEQRSASHKWVGAGGFVQLTTVTQFEIQTQILGHFPDRVGGEDQAVMRRLDWRSRISLAVLA